MAPTPPIPLPPGRRVHLDGRGTTFIRELEGPPGAPTVVLLHGWTANADLNWITCYQALGEHFNVVAMDHRGHGQGIRSRRRFRLADCADDVAALAAELGRDQIIPIGYSMGGPISLLTWHRHRDLVQGLVLCATSPFFSTAGPERTFFSMLPLLATAGRVTPRRMRDQVSTRILGGRADDSSPVGQWAATQLAMADPVAVADAGASLGRFDARPWLHEIDVPTVVVRTTRDNAVPPSRQTLLATEIPGARVVDVDSDHGACLMARDRFVPAVVSAARAVAVHPAAV